MLFSSITNGRGRSRAWSCHRKRSIRWSRCSWRTGFCSCEGRWWNYSQSGWELISALGGWIWMFFGLTPAWRFDFWFLRRGWTAYSALRSAYSWIPSQRFPDRTLGWSAGWCRLVIAATVASALGYFRIWPTRFGRGWLFTVDSLCFVLSSNRLPPQPALLIRSGLRECSCRSSKTQCEIYGIRCKEGKDHSPQPYKRISMT